MKRVNFLVIVMIAVFLIVSCKGEDNIETLIQPTLSNIPTPLPGKVSVIGKVISKKSNLPIDEIDVWLAKVIRQEEEAVYVLDTINSPSILTTANGEFQILNVSPGEYVLVIGNPEIMYEIISDETGKAKVWNFKEGQVEDVGELIVFTIQ
mgnify:CR=1 FL=1